ncbi:single-stranded DNA-binding protein [Paenibacillus macerans]|uniref:single-stranded DNA-binding protein n=1 Tax=Paenibacillus macerans TaxID=44252 RepID=UPI00203E78E0|nr:single-stranded DNA-binding protein [Paenibacillus macerans]MCM3703771.1 single-stranded DNA-binding protein [Paenibacillus macerans]
MLNRVVLIGRLTKDPDLRYTPSGVAVTTFNLAVERPFLTNGEKETDFIPIVTWRQLAETCANYLKKGRLTAVEGRIQVRHYDNNEGKRVYVTEVVADNVRFLESNREGGQQLERQEERPAKKYNDDPFSNDGKPIDISDDDLPF